MYAFHYFVGGMAFMLGCVIWTINSEKQDATNGWVFLSGLLWFLGIGIVALTKILENNDASKLYSYDGQQRLASPKALD